PVEPGETEALDGRFVPLEEILKHPLALGVIHGVKPIRYRLAGFLTSGGENKVGQAILPADTLSSVSRRRLKAGGSQDWLPHGRLGIAHLGIARRHADAGAVEIEEIGRASCRERG